MKPEPRKMPLNFINNVVSNVGRDRMIDTRFDWIYKEPMIRFSFQNFKICFDFSICCYIVLEHCHTSELNKKNHLDHNLADILGSGTIKSFKNYTLIFLLNLFMNL